MDHQELINFISRVCSTLRTDYLTIEHNTKELYKNKHDIEKEAYKKSGGKEVSWHTHHVYWNLVHINGSIVDLIRDLERHQEYLIKDTR